MVNGKMCMGLVKGELMVRIDPDIHNELLERVGARTMDFTKKPMKGFLFIDEQGTGKNNQLEYWAQLALEFNGRSKASKKRRK